MNKSKGNNLAGLNMKATGARLGTIMNEKGFNDRKLSEELNLSVQAVNKWRLGKSFPDINNMYLLLKLLNRKFEDVYVPLIDPELDQCDGQIFLEDLVPGVFDKQQ